MPQYSRREFIKISGLTAAFLALSACKPVSSISQALTATPTLLLPQQSTPIPTSSPTPTWISPGSGPDLDISRLLRRITFGIRQPDLAVAQQLGYENYIDQQIHYASILDPEMEQKLVGIDSLQRTPEELRILDQRTQPANDLIRATLLRAVYSKRQLYELMVDFWSNHFNINVRKNNVVFLKLQDDRDVIRQHALGKFSDLLSASAHSPAMLMYLDNQVSTKNQPNENYARELLELHTLGVDGGYTQMDVKEVARALTGWSTGGGSKNFGQFVFNQANHDKDAKLILGIPFLAGKGIEDGEKVLDTLAHHPSTAHFVATKLVRRFVSDTPPAGLITRAADTFTKTEGDIAAVMGTILHSPEFRASLGQKMKRPFEWIVSSIRALDTPTTMDKATIAFLDAMGQPLFRWPTPDGFPDNASAWVTSNDLLSRWNFSLALAFNILKDNPVNLSVYDSVLKDPETGIQILSQRFFGELLPDQPLKIIRDFVSSADPKNAIPGAVALLLASPNFQYR